MTVLLQGGVDKRTIEKYERWELAKNCSQAGYTGHTWALA
jgi:hypothetical protein